LGGTRALYRICTGKRQFIYLFSILKHQRHIWAVLACFDTFINSLKTTASYENEIG